MNKYEDALYFDYKKGMIDQKSKTHVLNELMMQSKVGNSIIEKEKDKIATQRSIDGQNTPHIEIHEIKKLKNEIEMPIIFESYIMNKFKKENFMEMFKDPHRSLGKFEDIAP